MSSEHMQKVFIFSIHSEWVAKHSQAQCKKDRHNGTSQLERRSQVGESCEVWLGRVEETMRKDCDELKVAEVQSSNT